MKIFKTFTYVGVRMITSVSRKDSLSQAEKQKLQDFKGKKELSKIVRCTIIYYFGKNLKNVIRKLILAWKRYGNVVTNGILEIINN